MLTAPLKQTPEYKRLLAGMTGAKPVVTALFGMPPTARAQVLAALCEDTGRPALVICAGEADATRFAEDACHYPDIDLHYTRRNGFRTFAMKDGTPYPGWPKEIAQ